VINSDDDGEIDSDRRRLRALKNVKFNFSIEFGKTAPTDMVVGFDQTTIFIFDRSIFI
jgi:hypothetical protein